MDLAWRVRIAVLWLVVAVCQSAGMTLVMFEQGAIRDLMAGHFAGYDAQSAVVQISVALYWVVPLAMAFLTLVLKDRANRWTNAVVVALAAVGSVESTTDLDPALGGVDFIDLFGTLVVLLILWHVWRWPRPTEATPPEQRQETMRRGA